jgi:hypothetical protein
MINLYDLLKHFQIAYAENVKNVGSGWIGLKGCPRCGDTKYHIGVSKRSGRCSCLKCGWKGGIVDFLKDSTKLPIKDILTVYKQYKGTGNEGIYQQRIYDNQTTTLPLCLHDTLPVPHMEYLRGRGFDPDLLQSRYDLKATWYLGNLDMRYRVIIPIYYDDVIVSWLGRGIFDCIEPRYFNCPASKSVIPAKQALYGVNYLTDTAVIVEGVFDAWKFGLSALSAQGAGFTTKQMYEIHKRGVKKVCWLYDPDETGREKASEASKAAALLGIKVWKYDLSGKNDLGDLTESEICSIREDILGRMA